MSVRDHYWRLVDVVARDDRRALQIGLFVCLTWLVLIDAVLIIGVEQGWIAFRQVRPLPWWVKPAILGTSGVLSVVAYLGLSKLAVELGDDFDKEADR
jgi:hypothetical protein